MHASQHSGSHPDECVPIHFRVVKLFLRDVSAPAHACRAILVHGTVLHCGRRDMRAH